MNLGRADPARVSVLALSAAAFLLAFTIPFLCSLHSRDRSAHLQVGTTVAAVSDRRADVAPSFRTAQTAGLKPAATAATPRLVENYGRFPLSFEANNGQTDSQVRFLSRGRGYTLFLTGEEAVLALRSASQESRVESRAEEHVAQHSLLNAAALPRSFRGGQLQRTTHYGPRSTGVPFAGLIPNPQSLIPAGSESRVASPDPLATEARHSAATLRLRLVGANPNALVTGLDELPGKSNYFLGNDPKKWRTNVANYAKVKHANVYPGVDLLYYGKQGRLEYDFVVAPGADPKIIKFDIEGAEKMEVNAQGDLLLRVDGGEVALHKPLVYQSSPNPESRAPNPGSSTDSGPRTTGNLQSSIDNRQFLNGRYILTAKNQVAFEVPAYDRTRPLVIDPVLSYSTYLGGSADEGFLESQGIAADAAGNAYVAGTTVSIDFPTTLSAYDRTCGTDGNCNSAAHDAFVTKLSPDGSSVVYSTYLGGSDRDLGSAIAVDSSGNAYILGATDSSNFPITPGAYQTTLRFGSATGVDGYLDAFVTKLNATGSGLVYSTYLGGNGKEAVENMGRVGGIAVDTSGSAYVGWTTESTDFPTTSGAYRRVFGGGITDAFITKLSPAGGTLAYSTYLGGSDFDQCHSIAVNSSGEAYVTGRTDSTDFPLMNAFQPAHGGCDDAFVAKLNSSGSALVYSTFLGGSSGDASFSIAVDSAGNAYVTGEAGADFPTTPGSFQPISAGTGNAFVAKLNPAEWGPASLVYATFFGDGTGGRGIAVDASGNAYVTGEAGTILTVNAFQSVADPLSTDAFVMKLSASGSSLLFSSYLGGHSAAPPCEGCPPNPFDEGWAIALDPSGSAYVTGRTISDDFPVTPGAFQSAYAGGGDAFVAKISFPGGPTVFVTPPTLTFGDQLVNTTSMPQAVTLTNTGNSALAISGIAVSGNFNQWNSCGSGLLAGSSCNIYVSFAPTAAGNRTGALTITDSAPGNPHVVPLSGTGVPTAGGAPAVTPSTLSLYFGNPVVSSTIGPQAVTVTNTGGAALNISNIGTTGDFAVASIGTTCSIGTPVAARTNCTISLTFTPTQVGASVGALTIADDAPDSPQVVTLIGIGMAPFYQFDGLPNVPAPTYDSSAKCVTQYYGCALTATGSLLTTFNSSVTPSSLDQFLSQPAINGYSDCGLVFATVPQLPALGNAVQLLPNWDPGTQDLNSYLAAHLSAQQQRVILQLCEVASDGSCAKDSKGDLKTHYIVATGPISSTDWQVFDPGWNDVTAQPNLTTLSGHTEGFYTSGGFHKYKVIGTRTFAGAADPSAFSAQAQSPVELLVTDPQGRRLGNAGTGDDIFEIPLGSYLRDFPLASDDGTGLSLGDPTGLKTAYVPSPEDGTYTVVATGTGSGSYTLDIQAVASDGTVQTASVSGVTAPGSTATYEVTYGSAPGSPPSVTRQQTGPIASLSTTAVSFGSQLVGTSSAAQTVTLTNTGDPELEITGISVSGEFVPSSTCGSMVPVSGSCTINITFTPAATGNRTGTLTINDNAPGSPHTVALSGTGTDFAVAAASGSSDSATVNAGDTATYNLQLAPTGFSGSVALACSWQGTQPRGTSCSVTPNSVTVNGVDAAPFAVNVSTTKRSVAAPRGPALPPTPQTWGLYVVPLLLALLGLAMLGAGAAVCDRRRDVSLERLMSLSRLIGRRPIGVSLLAALLMAMMLWATCGGGGGGGTTPPPQTGTPAGTYTLAVTGTTNGVSRSATLTLKVN